MTCLRAATELKAGGSHPDVHLPRSKLLPSLQSCLIITGVMYETGNKGIMNGHYNSSPRTRRRRSASATRCSDCTSRTLLRLTSRENQ